jgi:hypothetical protein
MYLLQAHWKACGVSFMEVLLLGKGASLSPLASLSYSLITVFTQLQDEVFSLTLALKYAGLS